MVGRILLQLLSAFWHKPRPTRRRVPRAFDAMAATSPFWQLCCLIDRDQPHPMPKFETRHPVAYSARQMYDLVADVEAYPEFLPLCDALKVRSRLPYGERGEVLTCAMDVGYGPIRERFTSRVTLDPDAQRINSTYIDGPFRRMDNRWQFQDTAAGRSDVTFFIDYEFKSMMLQMLMGSMFDIAFRRFTTAFEERARTVYGAA
jgi:coenzyme Q-binding protein COQ10